MDRLVKIKDYDGFLKNEYSKAILTNDVQAYQDFRKRKNYFSTLQKKVDVLEQEMQELKKVIELLKSR